jgi:hypothetical protein
VQARYNPFLSPRRALATAFAVALGLVADALMTVSQSLYSGDSIMPPTRVEWWDNIDYAALVAISYMIGHLTAHALRKVLGNKLARS